MKTMQEILLRWRQFTGDVKAKLGNGHLELKVLSNSEDQKNGFTGLPEPDDTFGLYFVYKTPRTLGFWMKDIPYDLDLVGFDENLKMFQVIRLKAKDETVKVLQKPCRHVLELRAGWCAEHQITPGMKLEVFDV